MSVWPAIVGAAAATYLTRAIPLAFTARARVPGGLARYLEALPVAIISALVGPALVLSGGALTRGAEPLAAIVVVAAVAWRRSLLVGVVVGVATVALLRAL